MKVNRVL